MMSLAAIRSESRRAARRSAAEHRGPLVIEQDDLALADATLSRHMAGTPFLGDRTPRGYKLVDMRDLRDKVGLKASRYRSLFVDASGFGSTYEPALTRSEFLAVVRTLGAGFAYSIEDAGQFQVNMRVMRPRTKEVR